VAHETLPFTSLVPTYHSLKNINGLEMEHEDERNKWDWKMLHLKHYPASGCIFILFFQLFFHSIQADLL
jgi:hypothetical protein